MERCYSPMAEGFFEVKKDPEDGTASSIDLFFSLLSLLLSLRLSSLFSLLSLLSLLSFLFSLLSLLSSLLSSLYLSSLLSCFSDDSHISPDKRSAIIKIHPTFRMIVLANRPGYPFLGNDFFSECGDCFSCHMIDNPDLESEMFLLQSYAPHVPK